MSSCLYSKCAIEVIRATRTFRFVLKLVNDLNYYYYYLSFCYFFFVDKLKMLITSNQNCLGEL